MASHSQAWERSKFVSDQQLVEHKKMACTAYVIYLIIKENEIHHQNFHSYISHLLKLD